MTPTTAPTSSVKNPPEYRNFRGFLQANGEFTIGYRKPKSKRDGKVKVADAHYEDQLGSQERRVLGKLDDKLQDKWQHHIDPLERTPKSRARKGQNGISTAARRKLRSACYLMEKKFTRHQLGLLTLTIPAADWLTDIWIERWPNLLARFVEELGRECRRVGLSDVFVGAVEIQMKRLKSYGVCCPHLHIVYQCRLAKNGNYLISADRFREIWKRLLVNELESELQIPLDEVVEEIEFDASIDCQPIKKNAEAYLGKYLSKGYKDVKEIKENYDVNILPTAWYTMNRRLSKAVRNSVLPLSSDMIENVVRGYWNAETKIFSYLREFDIVIFDNRSLKGWVGKMSNKARSILNEEIVLNCTASL